jgi:hypothetical protein
VYGNGPVATVAGVDGVSAPRFAAARYWEILLLLVLAT